MGIQTRNYQRSLLSKIRNYNLFSMMLYSILSFTSSKFWWKMPVLGKQTFVSHLQSGLGKLLKFCPCIPDLIAMLEQGSWTWWLLEVPSNLNYFVIKVTRSMGCIINNGHYFFRFLWQYLQNKHLSPEGLTGHFGLWFCWAGPKSGWGRSLKEQMQKLTFPQWHSSGEAVETWSCDSYLHSWFYPTVIS